LEKNDMGMAKKHLDESLRIQNNNPDTFVKLASYQ
jgi:Tfp pilus assembly protein PilF